MKNNFIQRCSWAIAFITVFFPTFFAKGQINTPSTAKVPFGSNTSYSYGIMPTNLPSGGQYGGAQDAATEYEQWKSTYVENCGTDAARVKFDTESQTVSEGIAYGLLLAAYAADKDLFDRLWQYYVNHMNSNGVMNWKIDGCNSATGFNGAADAEVDAAMALIVAETQWPDATSPFDYEAEAKTLIGNVKDYEIHPTYNHLINGDGWGFTNNSRNPGYQAPAYYKVWGELIPTEKTFWATTVVDASYVLINNNVSSAGLVSDWSNHTGSPTNTTFGYESCRSPWRMATDVIWWNDTDAATICTNIASTTQSTGPSNVKAPLNVNGTGGTTHNSLFVSTFAAGIMGATPNYQSHMNVMYTEAVTTDDAGYSYFGHSLRCIMLFMMSGNFWNPYDINQCTKPDLGSDASLCGVSNLTLNSGMSSNGVTTFQWYKGNTAQGSASTSNTSRTITEAGTWRVETDSLGCINSSEVVISSTLSTPVLPDGYDLCSPSSEMLDADVTGAGINYSWTQNGTEVGTAQTYNVTEAGDYEVTISASGCTSKTSNTVNFTSSLATVSGDLICSTGQADLAVTSSGTFEWFDQATDGTSLGTGATFTTPTISTTTTYYVENTSSFDASVGPTSVPGNTNQWGVNTAIYTAFSATSNFSVISLTVPFEVYGTTSGAIEVEVIDDNGNALSPTRKFTSDIKSLTKTPSGTAFELVEFTFTDFNIDISWGTDLRLRLTDKGDINGNPHWMSSGAATSYSNSPNPGLITITGGGQGNSGELGYFAEWQISSGTACDRTPVVAEVDPNDASCNLSCTPPSNTPVLTPASGNLTVCDMTTITSTSENGYYFQWYKDNSPISGENGINKTSTTINTDGSYKVRVVDEVANINNSSCYLESSSTAIIVESTVTPSIAITSNETSICSGTAVQFSISNQANEGTTPQYQWNINNSPVNGETGTSFTTTSLQDNDQVSLTLTSSESCVTSASVTSNSIDLSVTTTITPTVSISATNSEVCTNTNITFTASSVNGGNTPTYEWFINNTSTGAASNSNTFSTSTLSDQDVVKVKMTSSATCVSISSVTSNSITVTVNTTPSTPQVIGDATPCENASDISYSASSTGGATSYTWSGVPSNASFTGQGSDEILVDFGTTKSGNISVTASNTCGTSNAGSIAYTVSACGIDANFSTDKTNLCAGETVVFTNTTSTNGATNVSYVWNFGTGASPITATGNGPHTVTYSNSGTISASLEATSGSDVNTETKNNLITVNEVPGAPSITGNDIIDCNSNSETYTVPFTTGSTYDWTFPTSMIVSSGTGTNEIVLTPTFSSGNITVVETSSAGCMSSTGTLAVNYCPSGIEDENKLNINVYPNPFYHQFTVVIEGSTQDTYHISIVNNQSQLLYNNDVSSHDIIELGNDWAAGMYFITITNDTHVYTKRVNKL